VRTRAREPERSEKAVTLDVTVPSNAFGDTVVLERRDAQRSSIWVYVEGVFWVALTFGTCFTAAYLVMMAVTHR
jgi:hypothetical protein